MSFGQNLIALREERNISRKSMAEKLGIPYTTLRNYETDAREPGHQLLIKLAHIFGVSVDALVGNSITPTKQNNAPSVTDEALEVAKQYDSAPIIIKSAVRAVLSVRVSNDLPVHETIDHKPRTKIIPLHNNRFAAGSPESPGDLEWENYETTNMKADFAVHVNGDSMEPYLADGSIAFGVRRFPKIGEVGAFFLDGGFLIKQYVQDSQGNVYLFSGNRDRDDADMVLWHDADHDLRCYGTILCAHVPLP